MLLLCSIIVQTLRLCYYYGRDSTQKWSGIDVLDFGATQSSGSCIPQRFSQKFRLQQGSQRISAVNLDRRSNATWLESIIRISNLANSDLKKTSRNHLVIYKI